MIRDMKLHKDLITKGDVIKVEERTVKLRSPLRLCPVGAILNVNIELYTNERISSEMFIKMLL